MAVSALLLAAGLSERMGRPKPLLPWGDHTLVVWQVEQLIAAGVDDVVVVVGHEAAAVERALTTTSARVVPNPAYREGRATSLRRGAEALPDDAAAVVILNVDQPRPSWLTRRVLAAWREVGALVVQPRHAGHGGHPIVLAGALIPELRAVTEAGLGLRAVTDRHAGETSGVPFDTPLVLLDLNTPAEYEAALVEFESGAWAEPPAQGSRGA
jgi:molybdenum cofactor cytidylyltransferase